MSFFDCCSPAKKNVVTVPSPASEINAATRAPQGQAPPGIKPSPVIPSLSTQGSASNGGPVVSDTNTSAGIGISWFNDVSTGYFRVAGFTKNSSAAESGQVQPGDVLIDVDRSPAARKSLREVAMMILGPPGTTVTLRLLPVSEPLPPAANSPMKEITLVRRAIRSA